MSETELQSPPAWGSRWACRRPLRWRGRQSPAVSCSLDSGWAAPSPRCWCSGTPARPARKSDTQGFSFKEMLYFSSPPPAASVAWTLLQTCCWVVSPDVSSSQVNSSESVTLPNGLRSMSQTLPWGHKIKMRVRGASYPSPPPLPPAPPHYLPGCPCRRQTQLQTRKGVKMFGFFTGHHIMPIFKSFSPQAEAMGFNKIHSIKGRIAFSTGYDSKPFLYRPKQVLLQTEYGKAKLNTIL